ncbi:hypothetical protein BV20DRAFT_1057658 [Pilatotrama ljubarskyi]|nr:hypothetical protein BV20DRAFT_1057658 [Pilatotrama ljubarskyi]
MDFLHAPLAECLPYVCVALSSLLIVYLATSLCLRRAPSSAETNYAFAASTVVRPRPPTVLQFSARVPPGSNAVPMVLRSITPMGTARPSPSSSMGIKMEDGRPMLKSILTRSASVSVASVRNDHTCSPQSSNSAIPPPSPAIQTMSGSMSGSDGGGSVQSVRSVGSVPSGSIRQPRPVALQNSTATKQIARSHSRRSMSQGASAESRRGSSVMPGAAASELKLVRHRNPIRGNGKHDASHGRQYTWWFKTESEQEIANPPALLPSCGLQCGDLFWNSTPEHSQFWLRVMDETTKEETWQPIELGYERADGRILTITPKKQALSWVGGDWGSRRVSKDRS